MSIAEDIRIALLDLFPEQAEREAKKRAAAEIAARTADEDNPEAVIEAAAAEMETMELQPDAQEESEDGGRKPGIVVTDYQSRGAHVDVFCNPDQVVEAATILDRNGFFLETISGVDWIKEDRLEVIYDYSISGSELCRVVVRTFISRSEPKIDTISEIFPGADWHERETHDFYGIEFVGHPCLEPLLLPEDADFHPLLKDFKP